MALASSRRSLDVGQVLLACSRHRPHHTFQLSYNRSGTHNNSFQRISVASLSTLIRQTQQQQQHHQQHQQQQHQQHQQQHQFNFDTIGRVGKAMAFAIACAAAGLSSVALSKSKEVTRNISFAELKEHASEDSCWIAIDGCVYDITDFLRSHPGGKGSVLTKAGSDATKEFKAFHRNSVLSDIAHKYKIGVLDKTSEEQEEYRDERIAAVIDGNANAGNGNHVVVRCTPAELKGLPSISAIATEALRRGSPAAIAGYVNYGSEDEDSIRANRSGFDRYTMRPRVLRDVRNVNTTTQILGGRIELAFPVSIAPFAGAKVVHEEGELAVTRAACAHGVTYAVPHYGAHTLVIMATSITRQLLLLYLWWG